MRFWEVELTKQLDKLDCKAGCVCGLTVRCSMLQAIMESQNNPLAIMNYQDDPDVMLVSAPH